MNTGDRVVITKILNREGATHLIPLIDIEGTIISWLVFEGIKRYKVRFQLGLEFYITYFLEGELEKIEENNIN